MVSKEETPLEKSDFDVDPYLLMEEIADKLKLLDYEAGFCRIKGHKPLSRTYFAAKQATSNEQSVYFNTLAIWLLGLCGGQMSGDKKYEDPITMATNLLSEMKNVGINCDVPPNKLRTGYGDSVCIVLAKLIEAAFEKKKIQLKKPKIEVDKGKDKEADNVIEIEEESPELINKEIDFGDDSRGIKDDNYKEVEAYDNNDIVQIILTSNINPDEWNREVERVSSKLRSEATKNTGNYNEAEWRNHVDQIKNFEQNFSKSIPDTRGILENLSGDIDRSLEKISKKESMISKNFSNIITNYHDKHKEASEQLEEFNQLKEYVEKYQREYEDLEDKINENNNKFETLSKSISDTSSISNMKQAIQKLQSESISFDLKIHILNHSILKYKLNSVNIQATHNEGLDTSIFDELL